jgi:cystathionine beta-lyase/cystathionine gamma-synthase
MRCRLWKLPRLTWLSVCSLMQCASSLGGVESLMEHRQGVDPGSDPRLIRLSIGVEELEVCFVLAIYADFADSSDRNYRT